MHASYVNDKYSAETSSVASGTMGTGIYTRLRATRAAVTAVSSRLFFGTPESLVIKAMHEDARGEISASFDLHQRPKEMPSVQTVVIFPNDDLRHARHTPWATTIKPVLVLRVRASDR